MRRILLLIAAAFALASCVHVRVHTPVGFADMSSKRSYEAVSPEGMRYRVWTTHNYPEQSLEFWSSALRSHLLEEGYAPLSEEGETFEAGDHRGVLHEWVVPLGHESHIYLTAVVAAGKLLAVAEASAEHSVYDRHEDALRESLQSIVARKASTRQGTLPRRATPRRSAVGGFFNRLLPGSSSGSDEAPSESSPRAASPAPRKSAAAVSAEPSPGDTDALVQVTDRTEETRKRVYSGSCELVVDDVNETKTEVTEMAQSSGGYVELVSEDSIVIRVPAERFQDLFAEVLGLGDVIRKSIETFDVTEYFRDQETRLDIATRTRTRLYALLEKTTDVKERLAVLREIRRLTEEIERIQITLELVERQIDLSRITVQLTPRLEPTRADRAAIPFGWIAGLDPLYPSLDRLRERVQIALEDDFAVFEKEKSFRAESVEGTRVRAGSTENKPRGDTEFWQTALAYHLGKLYASAKLLDMGGFKGVLLSSKDAEPFYYLVATAMGRKDEKLTVLEVFFPDEAALGTRLEPIEKALKEMER